ncbi:hypothetical protein J1N35_031404 [Gossypium stocksii]|uniref:RWD domain-containing protein n=1 Tax=Gossypium stocksii TaxID=47602 RepID=A0A9D3V2J4_9ROSI|nr:hypothetical protein J1N35_031404 [Gossypium stocksii]
MRLVSYGAMNHVTSERIDLFPLLVEPLKKKDPFPELRVMSGPEEEKGKCSDLGQTAVRYIFLQFVFNLIAYHVQEQEMEIEALGAILMDELKEIHSGDSGLSTSNRCFQITLTPQYTGTSDLKVLKLKLEQEASENLGMAMIYTLVSSAKEWLYERYGQDACPDNAEEEEAAKDEDASSLRSLDFLLIVNISLYAGGTISSDLFLSGNCSAWRTCYCGYSFNMERFEAELALERAKLMPESALTSPKEKKLTGRQWFGNGRAKTKHCNHVFCGIPGNKRTLLFPFNWLIISENKEGASPVREGYDKEDEEGID